MTFLLNIVSPDDKIYQGQVKKITIPSIAGQLTILPHHAPLFTPLGEGIIRVVDGYDKVLEFPIGKGMLEVQKDRVEVLLEPLSERMAISKANIGEKNAQNIDKSKMKPTGDIPIREAFTRSLIDLRGIKIKEKNS